jgi:hypothetical protein
MLKEVKETLLNGKKTHSQIERLIIDKMVILPKLMLMLKILPLRISYGFFLETENRS